MAMLNSSATLKEIEGEVTVVFVAGNNESGIMCRRDEVF
jgi:hypothetical protein